MFKTVFVALGLSLLCGEAFAKDDAASPREIAESWLHAYEAQDFEAMRALLTDESVFIDPTSFDRPEVSETINWTGPDAIIAGVSAWGISHGEYDVSRTYESSGRVVFNAVMTVAYASPNGEIVYFYPITTIITVEDGHVIEHRDYTDFEGMRPAE
jgi:limonene-1,2-epoxide hydrolase